MVLLQFVAEMVCHRNGVTFQLMTFLNYKTNLKVAFLFANIFVTKHLWILALKTSVNGKGYSMLGFMRYYPKDINQLLNLSILAHTSLEHFTRRLIQASVAQLHQGMITRNYFYII